MIIGIAIVWLVFQSLNDRFLSPENLFNLSRQISYGGVVSLGLVLMLLIREIDLSVGSMAGLAGAVLAVLSVNQGWNPYLAIAATVALGLAIGLIQGLIRTIFNVPSFLVTLGGFLILFGLQLRVLGSTGSIQFPFEGTISGIREHAAAARRLRPRRSRRCLLCRRSADRARPPPARRPADGGLERDRPAHRGDRGTSVPCGSST